MADTKLGEGERRGRFHIYCMLVKYGVSEQGPMTVPLLLLNGKGSSFDQELYIHPVDFKWWTTQQELCSRFYFRFLRSAVCLELLADVGGKTKQNTLPEAAMRYFDLAPQHL